MRYGEYDITTGDYRFVSHGNGTFEAWRKGEPWDAGAKWLKDQEHSKSFVGMMMEFQDARDALYLLGKLFTKREIMAAMERRGIHTDREEGFTFALVTRAIDQGGQGRG